MNRCVDEWIRSLNLRIYSSNHLLYMMTNYDDLMISALDGTITPPDRAMLNAYFAQRPGERAAFEQMLAVDLVLKEAEPVASPPADFAQRVMAQTRVTPIIQPMRHKQVAVVVVGNSLLVVASWVMAFALLVGLVMLIGHSPVVQPALALGRAAVTGLSDVLHVVGSVARAMTGLPLAWVILVAAFGMVAAWFAVIARVWLPQRRLAFVQR